MQESSHHANCNQLQHAQQDAHALTLLSHVLGSPGVFDIKLRHRASTEL